MRYNESQECLYLEDLGALRGPPWKMCVSVFIEKWFYYIPRAKLTFVEGYHETAEQAQEAILKKRRGETTIGFPEDYPKHYELVCRPSDLLHLAKVIQKVCNSSESLC